MGCADLVEALERRLRGERTGPQQEAVDAHLPTCPDCRSYLESAERLERELGATAVATPSVLATSRSLARKRVEAAKTQRRRLKGFAAAALVVPLWDRAVGGPWDGRLGLERLVAAVGSSVLVVAAIGLAAVVLRRHIAPLELAQGDGELFLVYRAQLDRQLRRLRREPWLVGSLFALCVSGTITAGLYPRLPTFPWLTIGGAGLFAGSLVMLALLPTLRRRRDALLRERAALAS